MRLDVMALPKVADGGLADALTRRHEAATPVRLPLGLGLQGGIENRQPGPDRKSLCVRVRERSPTAQTSLLARNAPAIGALSGDLSPVRTQSRLPILPATTPTRCGTAAPPVGVCPSPPATARSHSADPPKASKAPPNEAHLIMLALPIKSLERGQVEVRCARPPQYIP